MIGVWDLFDRAHAIQLRHAQIEQCDVRTMFLSKIDSLPAIAGFGDDLHVRLAFD
jgi:hypothetical protein